ncbi:MAG: hypothetical protein HY241_00580 [Actinobacteria bacterium]|nr:hypothetical protein [Actinomycetota bacterium]
MIHLAESLAIHSVEGFLTPDEVANLTDVMDELLGARGPETYGAGRTATMHEVPGLRPEEAMAVYEPDGRVEVSELPGSAETLLQKAASRAMPTIAWVLPSVTSLRPWTYVEYGPGQHITPHADGIALDPMSWPRQIAGISVVVETAACGGGFYVETTSDERIWSPQRDTAEAGYEAGMRIANDGADNSSKWFRELRRTRWTVNPGVGCAIIYGSQLVHGTDPVGEGRARKFISWFVAERQE